MGLRRHLKQLWNPIACYVQFCTKIFLVVNIVAILNITSRVVTSPYGKSSILDHGDVDRFLVNNACSTQLSHWFMFFVSFFTITDWQSDRLMDVMLVDGQTNPMIFFANIVHSTVLNKGWLRIFNSWNSCQKLFLVEHGVVVIKWWCSMSLSNSPWNVTQ